MNSNKEAYGGFWILLRAYRSKLHSVIKSKGLFLTEVDLADGKGKGCGCKWPQALSISTVPADVKRQTFLIQSVGEPPGWWDYHLHQHRSNDSEHRYKSNQTSLEARLGEGQVCLEFCRADKQDTSLGLGTSWRALRDTGSFSPWTSCPEAWHQGWYPGRNTDVV